MAEWLVEQGIGEDRAALVENGHLIAARARWPEELQVGTVAEAKLIQKRTSSRRGIVSFPDGSQALIGKLPPDTSEGANIPCRITRPAIHERGRFKLAHAQFSDSTPSPAPTFQEQLRSEGHPLRIVQKLPDSLWEDTVTDALAAGRGFEGGSISLFATPAMTLIDVDGDMPPCELSLAAVKPIAHAIRTLDLGGNIGIDFPTIQAKADRRKVDEALQCELADWPHERTVMNGFGFVQIVSRLERVSLLHRASFQRAALMARQLLRDAEMLMDVGRAIELQAHPSVIAAISEEWTGELHRRSGREIRFRPDSALAIEGGHAQVIQV